MNPCTERLFRIREGLRAHDAHALLVTSSDPHLSEYLPLRWQSRAWLSGFTGSVATLVITREDAALFADSRYWVQAARELAGSGIALEKIEAGQSNAPNEWLAAHLAPGETVVTDGAVLGLATARALHAALDAAGIRLQVQVDLVGSVWPDRPGLPRDPLFEHLPPFATMTRAERLAKLRAEMQRLGASHHFISAVDDVAWLTNLRGSDVPYNPVFLAHLLITREEVVLCVAAGKIDPALAARLGRDGLRLEDYERAQDILRALPSDAVLLLDPRRVTLGMRNCVPAAVKVVEAINPSTLLKSRKSAAEVANVRETMREDGAALCEFHAWLETAVTRETVTELTIDEELTAARARRAGFRGLSFPTIAAWNANGAMPHYRATPDSHAILTGDGLLLIDSGGQYLGGTTDITRMWAIGKPTPAMKRDCTRVFQGMQALSRARFPRGTPGPMLDALARAPLWQDGIDFGHGTGHGVGYFLNVHEGPQSISKAVPERHMALEPGMITSNEPGVYRPGHWGVRIENLLLCRAVETAEREAFGEMLEFETLTLCPIDTRCFDPGLLRPDEIAWLNAYHARVQVELAPRLAGAALRWLEARTAPI